MTVPTHTLFCEECGADFAIAYSHESQRLYVVCECYESEYAAEFLDRIYTEIDSGRDVYSYDSIEAEHISISDSYDE